MSKLTIDEAIKHCLEVAEKNESKAQKIGCQFLGTTKDREATECRECAADHRQLAEWLTELKEARRLLKWAVEGFRKLGASLNNDGECDGDCLYCPINNHGNCLKWEYEDKALALIGEDGDTNGRT